MPREMISAVGMSPGKPEAGLYSSKTFRPVVQRFQVPEPVARALSRFADENRRVSLFRTAFWFLFVAQIAFTFTALLDRFVLIDDVTRIGMSVTVYSMVLLAGWKLLSSALRQTDPEDIALTIEQRATHLQLEERISTTVELARTEGATDGLSGAMIRRVAREAAALIQGLDIESLVDRSGCYRAAKSCGAVIIIVVALCLIPTLHLPLAYCRAFFPWMNLARPSSTQIGVITGNTRVVDGESVQIQIQVAANAAHEAYVETRQDSSGWQSVRMERDAVQPDRFALSIGPLHERIQYRVRANDGQSAAYSVEVLPRPEMASFALTVSYPRYTGLPAQSFDRFNDSIAVLKGSRIDAALSANTRLSAAVLEFSDGRLLSMQVENESAKASFEVNEDAAFRIRLRSIDEVGNPDAPLFSIHATLDLPPHVAVLKPEADESVELNAVLPLEARGEDDYGIASMRLVVKSEQGRDAAVIPLERPADGGKVWLVSQAWDLGGLFLASGETISYRVEAVDSNGAIGSSEERRLRVAVGQKIDRNLLLSELNAAQKSLTSARKLLNGAGQDNADFSQVFRPEDIDFQSAERLLFSESLDRATREIHGASTAIESGLPQAEAGALRTLLQEISEGLQRFAEHSMRPLQRGATRARSSDKARIKAGLDAVAELLPPAENELENLHEALTAAQRYAEASDLEQRSVDARDQQARILPALLGSMGWTPKGTVFPGLLAEYYKGSRFQTLIRRTIDPQLSMKSAKLPDAGAEGTAVRWSGQIFLPQRGRYTFRTCDGVKLSVDKTQLIGRWNIEIVDDAEKGFTAGGDWSVASAPGQCYQRVFHYAAAGKGARTATWTFDGLLPGDYRLAITWMPFFNRATDAPYSIVDNGKVIQNSHIDQQATPSDFYDAGIGWKILGDKIHAANGSLAVQLSDNANQYVIADAVRLERTELQNKDCGGSAELTDGWHDIVVEYHNCDRATDIVLERNGPTVKGTIPPEQLRTPGMAAASSDPRVRASMGKAASASAVEAAFGRLQIIVDAARALPRRLLGIAVLGPRPDQIGEREGTDWTRLVDTQTVELDGARVLTPALAAPLLQWTDQSAAWVKNFADVRERYRAALLHWNSRLAGNTFELATRVRQLQHDADSTEKAFEELVRVAKQPPDPKREKDMAKADAVVRAVAEDLRSQSEDIEAELRRSAADARKSPEERRALELLAKRADTISRGPAARLELNLNDLKTADALSKAETAFGANADTLGKAAAELTQMTERCERTVGLRDALKLAASIEASAKDTLVRLPSPIAAVAQQQVATELKESGVELQSALQSAVTVIDPNALTPVTQLVQNPLTAKAIEALNQRAAQTLSGVPIDPKSLEAQAQQQALRDLATELEKQAQSTRAAAQAVNGELKAMAQAWIAADPELASQPAKPDEPKPEAPKISGTDVAELTQKLHDAAEHNRKAAEYIERAKSLEEHTRERLKHDAPAVAQALRATAHEAETVAKNNPGNPVTAALQSAQKALVKAGQDNDDLAKKTDMLPLTQLADQLSTVSQDVEKAGTEIATALGKPEDAVTQSAQKIGLQTRGFAGWDADRAAELRRAARAEQLARENALETNGSRAELEKQVLAELDALDKQLHGKLDQSIVEAVRKSAGEDAKEAAAAQVADAKLDTIAERARTGAAQMEQLAARMDKIAQNAFPGLPGARSPASVGGKSEGKREPETVATEKISMPPQGIPIDKSTWNRLPDDLRRDLLNAAGGRFPAEYELSIRRYFKNVAASQESTGAGK